MRTIQFTCDECKTKKTDSNHWWLSWLDSSGEIHICPWNQEVATTQEKQHLCGQACVHRLLDRWMTSGRWESA